MAAIDALVGTASMQTEATKMAFSKHLSNTLCTSTSYNLLEQVLLVKLTAQQLQCKMTCRLLPFSTAMFSTAKNDPTLFSRNLSPKSCVQLYIE